MYNAKHWAGCTLNNYTDEDVECIITHVRPEASYYVFGIERGASGTPHLQFMVSFKKQKRLTACKKLFATKTSHWEMKSRHSTMLRSSNYCKKGMQTKEEWDLLHEDGPNFGLEASFVEYGTLPLDQHVAGCQTIRQEWEQTRRVCEEGLINEVCSEHYIKYYGTLQKIVVDHRGIPDDLSWNDNSTPNEWIYGPTGTGKSRKARSENPGCYIKMVNIWWENYNDEECVLIEDIDKYHVKLGGDLKIWGDRYGFRGNRKFSSVVLRPQKIVVTSNYRIREIWTDPQTYEPLERRFKEIYIGPIRPPPLTVWSVVAQAFISTYDVVNEKEPLGPSNFK